VSERVYTGYQNFIAQPCGTLAAIGNFDGVHLGHRALIEHALEQCRVRALVPVVMTFDPHPAAVLATAAPPILTTTERKVDLLLRLAPELNVIVQPFDKEFAKIEAEDFVKRILLQTLGARFVLVGSNFHFGRARRGTPDLLRALADQWRFEAEAFELSGDQTGTFSSNRVRSELADGNMLNVAKVLGRPHAITGVVVSGDGRGKKLDFPTANLEQIAESLPPAGVYVCIVDEVTSKQGALRVGLGVMSLGARPTVNRDFSTEVHVLDFSGDLYKKRLRIHVVQRLRSIMKFPDVSRLRAQIVEDISVARNLLAAGLLDDARCADL
jgi:riboflavin kinase/FMN adenylyltransferase